MKVNKFSFIQGVYKVKTFGTTHFIVLITITSIITGHAETTGEVIEAAPGQGSCESIILGAIGGPSLTAPADIIGWVLYPNHSLEIQEGMLIVDVQGETTPWTVVVAADDETGGYLSEYTSGQRIIGGKRVESAMKIEAEGGNEVDLSKGGELISGKGDSIVIVRFIQEMGWSDEPLQPGHEYCMNVSFAIL